VEIDANFLCDHLQKGLVSKNKANKKYHSLNAISLDLFNINEEQAKVVVKW